MSTKELNALRLELSVKSKNGIDFLTSATLVWIIISIIWTMDFSSYDKSVLTFIAGGIMLPLAFAMSKVYKTQWKVSHNILHSLGLWLNFAQLFYFPFLIFILIKQPDYFIMTYVIITGAHFFPYAWFYNEVIYAIAAGLISVGALLIALFLPPEDFYLIGLFIVICLTLTTLSLYFSYKNKSKKTL